MKFLKVLILILAVLCMGGCEVFPIRTEIGNLKLAQAVGIDTSNDMSVMTVACMEQSTSSGGDGGETKSIVLKSEGPTLMEALKKIQLQYDKTIFLGHSNYFIFGEDTTKEDFYKYFAFLENYYEIRLRSKIYIAKESSAYDVLSKASKGELFIADRLEKMSQKGYTGPHVVREMDMIELQRLFDKKFSAAAIPALVLIDRESDMIESEKKIESDLDIYGYAIIKDFKLAGYLDYNSSRGYNFIKKHPGYPVMHVKDSTGLNIALQVTNSKIQFSHNFKDDTLEGITITIKFRSSLTEQQSRQAINNKTIEDMEQQQNDIIKSEITSLIDTAQQMNADFLGIDDTVRQKHPIKWEKMKDKWNEIFPNVKFDIVVDSVIRRSHDIVQPAGYREEN